jgi:hypothetical protein
LLGCTHFYCTSLITRLKLRLIGNYQILGAAPLATAWPLLPGLGKILYTSSSEIIPDYPISPCGTKSSAELLLGEKLIENRQHHTFYPSVCDLNSISLDMNCLKSNFFGPGVIIPEFLKISLFKFLQ